MSKQIAAVSTKTDRLTLKIDGVSYDLLNPEDMTLKDAVWLSKSAPRIDSLISQDSDSLDAVQELADLILKVTDIFMSNIPKTVRSKLTDIQKLSVIKAYVEATGGVKVSVPLAEGEDGKSSSLDSSGSTEGAP